MLPELDGLEVCRRIRARHRVPILFLSARGEEVDRIVGLELGGDDYLTKPFSPRELTARVRAVFRRVEAPAAPASTPVHEGGARPTVLLHGEIEIDTERHEVRYAGSVVSLTPTEFGVLGALLERPGVVLSRGQLMQRAYRYDNLITERTIDTHVRRIRAKFRAAGGDPIATVHGVGYKAASDRPFASSSAKPPGEAHSPPRPDRGAPAHRQPPRPAGPGSRPRVRAHPRAAAAPVARARHAQPGGADPGAGRGRHRARHRAQRSAARRGPHRGGAAD